MTKQAFTITKNDETIIRGDLFRAKGTPQGTLIICHGYKGFKDWGMFPYMGESFSEHFDVITFNFSHNGVGEDLETFSELEKFAKNTYSNELEDLDAVVRQVRGGNVGDVKFEVQPGPTYLLGHSRGAGVCFIYAFDHPERVDGVVSWNGITNVDLFSEEEKEKMRTEGRAYVVNGRTGQHMPLDRVILDDMEANNERFNILERVKEAQVPIALVQGSDDHKRLWYGSKQLMKQSPSTRHIVIEGGNHTFLTKHPFEEPTPELEEAIRKTKHFICSLQ